MLVLSRNKNQGIKFPSLGVSVEILEVAGSKVKVGVDAPMEVRVLRDELLDGDTPKDDFRIRLPQSMQHELRNALNEISLSLGVYMKRIERGETDTLPKIDAEEMFQAVIRRLEKVGDRKQPFLPMSPQQASNEKRSKLGTALVVDDDDNERELLAGFLRMCDYQVETVRDGIEAEDYLNTNDAPRFILLDMFMPRCDGRQFLTSLRSQPAYEQTHVFVVSGSSAEELNMSAQAGYTRWFGKPLDPRRIVEALSQIEAQPIAKSA